MQCYKVIEIQVIDYQYLFEMHFMYFYMVFCYLLKSNLYFVTELQFQFSMYFLICNSNTSTN